MQATVAVASRDLPRPWRNPMGKILPTTLTIEANASCQLRCPTCPTTGSGYPPLVGSGYLRLDDLRNIIEGTPRIRTVSFDNRGELFLNKDLLGIMEYCAFKKVTMMADGGANLNHVGEGVLEGLVKYRFRSLACAIDGATPETYRLYRRGGDFDNVIDHIRQINRFKAQYDSPYPELSWQYVVFGHNEHELPLAKKMAKELNMSFRPKMSWDSEYSPVRDKKFVMAETGWPAVTREEFEQMTGANYVRDVCLALWESPRINWDGKVLGCCWNSWQDFGGNAFQDGFVNVVNSANMNLAREMLLGKRGPSEEVPCSRCEMYVRMRGGKRFLTTVEVSHGTIWYRTARFVYRKSGLRLIKELKNACVR